MPPLRPAGVFQRNVSGREGEREREREREREKEREGEKAQNFPMREGERATSKGRKRRSRAQKGDFDELWLADSKGREQQEGEEQNITFQA